MHFDDFMYKEIPQALLPVANVVEDCTVCSVTFRSKVSDLNLYCHGFHVCLHTRSSRVGGVLVKGGDLDSEKSPRLNGICESCYRKSWLT